MANTIDVKNGPNSPVDEESARDGAPALTLDVPEPERAAQAAGPAADDPSPAQDAPETPDQTGADDPAIAPDPAALDPLAMKLAPKNASTPTDESWKAAMDNAAERMDGAALADAATKGSVLNVTLSDEAFGLETAEDQGPEEEVELSAFDRDEITDPTADGIDPLMLLIGGGERPWENESLSFLERMSLYGYNRNLEAVDAAQTGQVVSGARIGAATVVAGAAVAGIALAIGANPASAGPQNRATDAQNTQNSGPKQNDPQRSETSTLAAQKSASDAKMQAEARQIETKLSREALYRQNVDDVAVRRLREASVASALTQKQGHDIADEMMQGPSAGDALTWDGTGGGNLFDQTMGYLYSQLGADPANDPSAGWRAAMWDEKRVEFTETAHSATAPAQTVEIPVYEGPAMRPPEPEQNFQMSFAPGMGM